MRIVQFVLIPRAMRLLKKSINEVTDNQFKVITLCGSLKFQETFNDVQMKLERMGHVCFSVGFSERRYQPPTDTEKSILDKVHFKKIALSDCILVIDNDGYIGHSTRNEIEFARLNNKQILFLSVIDL